MAEVGNYDGEAQPSSSARRPSTRFNGADLSQSVQSLGGPLALLLFAGVIQAASAIQICVLSSFCTGLSGYNMAVGLVSSILVAFYLVVFMFAADSIPDKSLLVLAVFLFVWWGAGVGVLTFYYSATFGVGTAYFATWICFLLSALILHSEASQFQNALNRVRDLDYSSRYVFYILLASVVVLIAGGVSCGNGGFCSGYDIFAIIVGALSSVACGILLLLREKLGFPKFVAVGLCLVWFASCLVLTVLSPFLTVGNGFFGAWAAFFTSFFLAQSRLYPTS